MKNEKSKIGKSMQFSKLVINLIPNTLNGKAKKIIIGSCFCWIEGDQLIIDCIKPN